MTVMLLLGMLSMSRGFIDLSLRISKHRQQSMSKSMLSVDQQSSMDLVLTQTIHPSSDPADLEVEMLTGMSHVTLDFPTLLFATQSKQSLRLFALIGRLSLILADYIPDHSIKPEELGIQIVMLALTLKDIFKSSSTS